jgi:hypothetical protein
MTTGNKAFRITTLLRGLSRKCLLNRPVSTILDFVTVIFFTEQASQLRANSRHGGPGSTGSPSVALRTSQSCGGGNLPRLHTGLGLIPVFMKVRSDDLHAVCDPVFVNSPTVKYSMPEHTHIGNSVYISRHLSPVQRPTP